MKISALITELESAIKTRGDLDIVGFMDGEARTDIFVTFKDFKDTPDSEPRKVVVIEF